ncbi:MAG TPA: outer membrane beta-barrel protein [Verrucomicrobiales bacterium]|nr:outer membrane beta-barrel protein [Verrucomicrobiales bacterium]
MEPTFRPFSRPPRDGVRRLWPLWLIFVAMANAEQPQFGTQNLPPPTRAPSPADSKLTPPLPEGPDNLTTDLEANEAVTPLMPDGMEKTGDMPPPVLAAPRRWTFFVEGRAIYDDNIFLSANGQEKSSMVMLLTPSLTFRTGDTMTKRGSYAIVGYTPSASFFIDESDENSLDHTARFELQKSLGKLAVAVDGKYQRLSGATAELSDRVDRDEAGARARAHYDVSLRTGIETSVAYNTVRYLDSGLDDYDEWVSETFIGYEFSGHTRMGAGGAVGRLNVDGQNSQSYQRALVRVTTDPTGKITLDAKAGVEFRHTDAGKQTTPVFNLAAEYRPTGRTSIGVSVYRDVSASGSIENENVTRTGATLRIMQKLSSRFTAGVEAGYERLEYTSTESGAVSSGREDDYFFLRPSLRYDFSEGRRAEIYYSLRQDDSTISDFDFTANQTGLAVGFDF